MGVRATGRKLAMQALYQAEVQSLSIEKVIDTFLAESNYLESTKTWAMDLAKASFEYRSEADKLIKKYAIDWDLGRMNPIDKSILRLAFYEIKHTDTPVKVALNEAIEISKKYSTEDSPKFINGILGNYVKKECSQDSSKK